MRETDTLDSKGLIREAYRIDGIGPSECRSIFLDWALSLPVDVDQVEAVRAILERYAEEPEDHPMHAVLREGLARIGTPRRRGGWRARPRN